MVGSEENSYLILDGSHDPVSVYQTVRRGFVNRPSDAQPNPVKVIVAAYPDCPLALALTFDLLGICNGHREPTDFGWLYLALIQDPSFARLMNWDKDTFEVVKREVAERLNRPFKRDGNPVLRPEDFPGRGDARDWWSFLHYLAFGDSVRPVRSTLVELAEKLGAQYDQADQNSDPARVPPATILLGYRWWSERPRLKKGWVSWFRDPSLRLRGAHSHGCFRTVFLAKSQRLPYAANLLRFYERLHDRRGRAGPRIRLYFHDYYVFPLIHSESHGPDVNQGRADLLLESLRGFCTPPEGHVSTSVFALDDEFDSTFHLSGYWYPSRDLMRREASFAGAAGAPLLEGADYNPDVWSLSDVQRLSPNPGGRTRKSPWVPPDGPRSKPHLKDDRVRLLGDQADAKSERRTGGDLLSPRSSEFSHLDSPGTPRDSMHDVLVSSRPQGPLRLVLVGGADLQSKHCADLIDSLRRRYANGRDGISAWQPGAQGPHSDALAAVLAAERSAVSPAGRVLFLVLGASALGAPLAPATASAPGLDGLGLKLDEWRQLLEGDIADSISSAFVGAFAGAADQKCFVDWANRAPGRRVLLLANTYRPRAGNEPGSSFLPRLLEHMSWADDLETAWQTARRQTLSDLASRHQSIVTFEAETRWVGRHFDLRPSPP